jgi:hypothetical protein
MGSDAGFVDVVLYGDLLFNRIQLCAGLPEVEVRDGCGNGCGPCIGWFTDGVSDSDSFVSGEILK